MACKITKYSFSIGESEFSMSHKSALDLYKYLNGNNVFASNTLTTVKENKISIQTSIKIDGSKVITLDLIELKELYHTLKDLFVNMLATEVGVKILER